MPKTKAPADVVAAWRPFFKQVCLPRHGDAARFGTAKATLNGTPGRASLHADMIRTYRNRRAPAMPGLKTVRDIGRVLRAMGKTWCSDLTMLYAASYFGPFVELVIRTSTTHIPAERLAEIILAIPQCATPIRADTRRQLSSLMEIRNPKILADQLRIAKITPEVFEPEKAIYHNRESARKTAILTADEDGAFEKAWNSFIAETECRTRSNCFILARLVGREKLAVETKRKLILELLYAQLTGCLTDGSEAPEFLC